MASWPLVCMCVPYVCTRVYCPQVALSQLHPLREEEESPSTQPQPQSGARGWVEQRWVQVDGVVGDLAQLHKDWAGQGLRDGLWLLPPWTLR